MKKHLKILLLSLGDRPSGPTTWKNGLLEALQGTSVETKEIHASSLFSLRFIREILWCDVVHTFHTAPSALVYMVLARLASKRVVFTTHGDVFTELANKQGIRRLLWVPFHRWSWALAQHITFPSEYLKKQIISKVPGVTKKSVVIYNGIAGPESLPPRSLPTTGLRLLTVTSFTHEPKARGVTVLAQAVEVLRASGLPAVLSVYGAGHYAAHFKAQSSEHVQFHGATHEVGKLHPVHDIFVYASFLDNLPYALLEAMAAGMPVVTTPTGGIPEVVSPEFLVEPSGEAFAATIRRIVVSNEAYSGAAKASVQAAAKVAWKNIAQDFIALYHAQS